MDRETYNASIEDEISNTNDISRLNDIIEEDDWSTSISHLAFHRILQLVGVDNALEIETENNTEGDLALENRMKSDHSRNIKQEDVPISDEVPIEYIMIGGDNQLSAGEYVSNTGKFNLVKHLLLID